MLVVVVRSLVSNWTTTIHFSKLLWLVFRQTTPACFALFQFFPRLAGSLNDENRSLRLVTVSCQHFCFSRLIIQYNSKFSTRQISNLPWEIMSLHQIASSTSYEFYHVQCVRILQMIFLAQLVV